MGGSEDVRGLDDASLGAREALVNLASRYHASGWMLGTSGNLSARYEGREGAAFTITASGLDKGLLSVDDFVEMSLSGQLIGAGPSRRPSAETSIHDAVYRTCVDARVVLHVHTVASTEVARRREDTAAIRLTDLEMLKGWGYWEPGAQADLPVFANHAEVPQIASDLESWLREPEPSDAHKAPAMLISGHGLTAWGASFTEAHRHLEITEFLCRVCLSRLGAEH